MSDWTVCQDMNKTAVAIWFKTKLTKCLLTKRKTVHLESVSLGVYYFLINSNGLPASFFGTICVSDWSHRALARWQNRPLVQRGQTGIEPTLAVQICRGLYFQGSIKVVKCLKHPSLRKTRAAIYGWHNTTDAYTPCGVLQFPESNIQAQILEASSQHTK